MNHSPIEPLTRLDNYVSEITNRWNNNFISSGIFTSDWQNHALGLNNTTSNAPIANSQNTNLTAQAIAVTVDRADLILQNPVIPSSASIGSNIDLKYQVKNQGISHAIANPTKFYSSPDKNLNNDNKYLSYDALNIIAAGVNTAESNTLKIDNSISQADNNQVVSESNARNNIVASAINTTPALPDLIIQNVVSPSSTVVGNNIQLKYQVKNQGSETAFSSYTLFYISKDKTISDDDFYLGSDSVDTLVAGANIAKSTTYQIPNNIAAGTYYLILQADGNGDLLESNENNNIFSQGKYLGNAEIKSAVQYASSKGAIVVMAAGNDGGSTPYYPANYAQNWGLAVGAVDRYGEIASFSNLAGSELIRYVTAPGVSVYSTVPNNKYASWNGTSMATPHVAGVVALMLSANKNLTDAQVRKIVTATASNNLPA